jgi:NOL1/NOP2/fmu family ribosome biogenesis protein
MEELSKKQVKDIIKELERYYSIKELKLDYLFLRDAKNKIYLINKDYKNITTNMRINQAGLYFLNITKDLRLSIEGSQIIGKLATKNIYKMSDKDLKEWLKGFDLETDDNSLGYKLMKNKNDFYGVGYFKENKIRNFIPKSRRIK